MAENKENRGLSILNPSGYGNIGANFRITAGVVLETFPFLRVYKVAIHGGPVTLCTSAGDSGFGLLSVTNVVIYPVGSTVLVLLRPGSKYGIIIGSIPPMYLVFGAYNPEELVTASNTGFMNEPFYREMFERMRVGLTKLPFWMGSCTDSIEGDWGYIADTGVGLYANLFEAGLKVNDYCGVWANYIDSLLRVAGVNFQEWTAGTERNVYLDWNLIWGYEGTGSTIYDQLGYLGPFSKAEAYREIPPSKQEALGSKVSNVEPTMIANMVDPQQQQPPSGGGQQQPPSGGGQQQENPPNEKSYGFQRLPFHAYQRWFGSVSPGHQAWYFSRADSLEAFPVPWPPRPLAHIGITPSGYCLMRSVNGVLLAKYPYISAPVRVFDGDEGAGRLTKKEIENAAKKAFKESEDTPDKKYTTVLCNNMYDIHNFIANWEAQIGFNIFTSKFTYISESMQHSYADLIYPNEKDGLGYKRRAASFIYLDPYGNICLTNGAGSCIEMIGDTIRISAPGRVLIDGGNNVKLFAPRIVNIAEYSINNIASKEIGSYIIRKSEELDRRVLAGVKVYEYKNMGYLLVPEDVITKIHTLYSASIVGKFVGQTDTVRMHDFVLDDLNSLTLLNFPVQSWAWYYRDDPRFDMSKLVIPERWNTSPSTIDLDSLISEEPTVDRDNYRQKRYKDIHKTEVVEELLINKSAANHYTRVT